MDSRRRSRCARATPIRSIVVRRTASRAAGARHGEIAAAIDSRRALHRSRRRAQATIHRIDRAHRAAGLHTNSLREPRGGGIAELHQPMAAIGAACKRRFDRHSQHHRTVGTQSEHVLKPLNQTVVRFAGAIDRGRLGAFEEGNITRARAILAADQTC